MDALCEKCQNGRQYHLAVADFTRRLHCPLTMRNLDDLFAALARSTFRSRFRLGPKEREYLDRKGLAVVVQHADRFIRDRLAPSEPRNDGRQTPMRGHPVFIAQHATATCCRSCLSKWHRIEQNSPLTGEQIDYVVLVISRWLQQRDRPCENS